LIQLNNDYLSKPTVEGDNWMITQQTASYLIKQMTAAVQQKGPPKEIFEETCRAYLSQRDTLTSLTLDTDTKIVEAFQRRALDLTYKAYHARIVEKKLWNSLLIQLYKLSRAHSQSMLVSNFHTALINNASTLSSTLHETLLLLFRLFALYTMDNEAREFAKANAVNDKELDALPDKVQQLMALIRPHAVRLVDAWAIPDFLLDSALGRYDGRVYEDLFNRAHRLNPLNEVTFNPDYRSEEIVHGEKDGMARILSKL